MCLTYRCKGTGDMEPRTWDGTITLLDDSHLIEARVTARGSSFHIIVGRHQYGNFICIPDWGIGTDLADLSDCFWNLEKLTAVYPKLSLVDAISITDALAELSLHYCI